MPQLYCQLASRPSPWLLGRTSAGLCTLQTACPLTVTYSGGTPAADTIAAGSAATVYGGRATAFDASADVWVVLTVPASGALQVVKEADLATVTGDWAGLARVVQHSTEPYQPQAYLAAGSVLTTTTTTLVSDAGARAVAIAAGTDPEVAYPGWTTAGFDDSAWAAAVPVTPNSGDLALVPAGASALWTKASGAPYQVSGAAIAPGSYSIDPTNASGATPGWALTVGHLYALETVGGPYYQTAGTSLPVYTQVQVSQDGGATWHFVDTTATDSWETTSDSNHWRVYFTASATALRVRVYDTTYTDNHGTIDALLSPAEAIEALVRGASALGSAPISSAQLLVAFDSAGDAWVNAVHEAADAGTTAAGPLESVSVAPSVLTPGASNVVAAHARGTGGSSPDKGWVAFSLAVASSGLAPGAGGTVTSVALAGPPGTTVGGSPVTGSGTLSLSWSSQSSNTFLGAPSGSSGPPTFRALVAADVPGLPAAQITSGQLAPARGGTGLDGSAAASGALLIGTGSGYALATLTAGSGVTVTNGSGTVTIAASGGGGTVSSVALTVPGFLSVSGSPLTTSGTLAVTLATQTAATVFAGPAAGSAAAPTFRALQGSDLPAAASAGGHIHAHGHFL